MTIFSHFSCIYCSISIFINVVYRHDISRIRVSGRPAPSRLYSHVLISLKWQMIERMSNLFCVFFSCLFSPISDTLPASQPTIQPESNEHVIRLAGSLTYFMRLCALVSVSFASTSTSSSFNLSKTTSQAVKKATNFSKQFVNHTRNCYILLWFSDPYDTHGFFSYGWCSSILLNLRYIPILLIYFWLFDFAQRTRFFLFCLPGGFFLPTKISNIYFYINNS